MLSFRDDDFKNYPPEARALAITHIALFRKLPITLAQLLLEEVQEYDWRFPAERRDIAQQLSYLGSLPGAELHQLLQSFDRLRLPERLTNVSWASSPGAFAEQLSTHLWSTHQIDAFRDATSDYLRKFNTATSPPPLPVRRLGMAVIGKGVDHNGYRLFRKFRQYGTYFTRVNPADGLQTLLGGAAARAAAHPEPFAHWYIDGAAAEPVSNSLLTTISYGGLEPARKALLRKIDRAIRNGIPGPEALTSLLHKMRPEEIGLPAAPQAGVLSRFQLALLTAGSGTQIFSTTFVQWATRELWRRAQPLTILARFAPRQRQRPMNELLSGEERNPELDPQGSLIDADMGAFYMWLDQQRLSGANDASFLVWFENHSEAFVVSPSLPRNTESNSAVDMRWLLSQVA